jgi:hypothetical protein
VQRRITAKRVAAILYGVISIMTAELSVQGGEFGHAETALGALLVGFAMTVTRIFIELVKKETEIGAHLSIGKSGAIVRDSMPVMLFPAMTALLVVVAALITVADSSLKGNTISPHWKGWCDGRRLHTTDGCGAGEDRAWTT